MNKNYYAVIMAGGVGSRFWPLSTSSNPKQFHDMLGAGHTLIQKTFNRLAAFIPKENILVLTNERYHDLVLEQLPMIRSEQVVLEPCMRNTAPCILYAALKIRKNNPDALMIVAPSDHWIEDEAAFASDVLQCFDRCEKEAALCTLGITPTFPNTGFGYIEFDKTGQDPGAGGLKKVKQFREKPDYELAKSFVAQGNFLWNAGIFVWSVQTILKAFEEFQPTQYRLFEGGLPVYNTRDEKAFIAEHYPQAENISIDYAILEKSRAIYVLPAGFDWNDLGTWGSLYDKLPKDDNANAVVNARVVLQDAKGNMIRSGKDKLVVVDGLSDFIIVDRDEVLLIFPKLKEQDIKSMVASVKEAHGDQYL